jgi:alkyl sulfatase BDS1-like metallo-beta-lactamase superfamily hydrolase
VGIADAEWFSVTNERLASYGPAPLAGPGSSFRLVFEFTDGGEPHAITLTLGETCGFEPGDHLMADCVIALSRSDADAMISGSSTSAAVLREGRLKVRGDASVIVALSEWLRDKTPLE